MPTYWRTSPSGASWIQCWVAALLVTSALLLEGSLAKKCGRNTVCGFGMCCGRSGSCGSTFEYCGAGCQSGDCRSGLGINFGQDANNLQPPATVVSFLKSAGVKSIRLYHTYPDTMAAFANSGIDLIISIPNADVKSANIASGVGAAQAWLNSNVSPYISSTVIKVIAVGNEVTDVNDPELVSQIVPAMQNLNSALLQMGLAELIKVSTPLSPTVLSASYPPSAGAFQNDLVEPFIKPVLDFLAHTKSMFMVDLYPYFAYKGNEQYIDLQYALLNHSAGHYNDPKSGLIYTNLLAQQVDAVITAIAAQGYPDMPLILAESGWPSAGDEVATLANAAEYNQNLVNLVMHRTGTPMRPGVPLQTYVFALFNENEKNGAPTEQNFGLFYPNLSPVYQINLRGN